MIKQKIEAAQGYQMGPGGAVLYKKKHSARCRNWEIPPKVKLTKTSLIDISWPVALATPFLCLVPDEEKKSLFID